MGKLATKLAHGKEDVLLVGEPGTGKRTLGIEIHNERGRKKPVVILDAGSAFDPEVRAVLAGGYGDLGEAMVGRRLVPLTDYASLIIAEAEKLAPHNQSLLVSFLKEGRKKYEGIKIIVTISEPLESLGQSGVFSVDLLGYLEKFEVVEVPALRERLEDIPALVAAMAKQMCASFGKSPKEIDTNTNHILSQGQWPGNIRQLAAVVGKAVLISHGDKLELPGDFLDERQHLTDAIENIMSGKVFVLDQSLDIIEKLLIQRALRQFMYNQSKTAQVLGLSEANFRYRLKKFGLPSIRQKV
jgi:DNA-binding NtrC family response regulator